MPKKPVESNTAHSINPSSTWETPHVFVTTRPNMVDYGPYNTMEDLLITSKTDDDSKYMFACPSLWYKEPGKYAVPCSPPCNPNKVRLSSCKNGIYKIGMEFQLSGVPDGVRSSDITDPIYLDPDTGILTISSHVDDVCSKSENGNYEIDNQSYTLKVTPIVKHISSPPGGYPNVIHDTPLPVVEIRVSFVWVNAWCTDFTAILGKDFLTPDVDPVLRCAYLVYPLVSDVLQRDPGVVNRINNGYVTSENGSYSYSMANGYADGYELDFSVIPPEGGWTNDVYVVDDSTPVSVNSVGSGVVVVTAPPPRFASGVSDSLENMNVPNPISQKTALGKIREYGMTDDGKPTLSSFKSTVTNDGFEFGRIHISSPPKGANRGFVFSDITLRLRWMLPDAYRELVSNSLDRNPEDHHWQDFDPRSSLSVSHNGYQPRVSALASVYESSGCKGPTAPLRMPPKPDSSQASSLSTAMKMIGVGTCTTQSSSMSSASIFGGGSTRHTSSSKGCDAALAVGESYNTFSQNVTCHVNKITQDAVTVSVTTQKIVFDVGKDLVVGESGELLMENTATASIVSQSSLQNSNQQDVSNMASSHVKSTIQSIQNDSSGWGAQPKGGKTLKTIMQNMNSIVNSQDMNIVTQNVFAGIYVTQGTYLTVGRNAVINGRVKITNKSATEMLVGTICSNILNDSMKNIAISANDTTTRQIINRSGKGMPGVAGVPLGGTSPLQSRWIWWHWLVGSLVILVVVAAIALVVKKKMRRLS